MHWCCSVSMPSLGRLPGGHDQQRWRPHCQLPAAPPAPPRSSTADNAPRQSLQQSRSTLSGRHATLCILTIDTSEGQTLSCAIDSCPLCSAIAQSSRKASDTLSFIRSPVLVREQPKCQVTTWVQRQVAAHQRSLLLRHSLRKCLPQPRQLRLRHPAVELHKPPRGALQS